MDQSTGVCRDAERLLSTQVVGLFFDLHHGVLMKRVGLFCVCGVAIAGPSAAVAKEVGVADHTHTVTTVPLKLASPQCMLDYEKRVADKEKFGVSATAGCRNDNSLWLRIANGAAEEVGAQYSIRQVVGSTGVNLYLRDFNRGWFSGIGLDWTLRASRPACKATLATLATRIRTRLRASATFAWGRLLATRSHGRGASPSPWR